MSAVAERTVTDIIGNPTKRTVLRLPQGLINSEKFFAVCRLNDFLRLERNANGDIVIMPPSGSEAGAMRLSLAAQLYNWNARTKLGKAFDASAGFTLPDSAVSAPDAAWIALPRWRALTKEQRTKFAPICPDFVAELMSPSDRRSETQAKMREYVDNGVRLGWLIDPQRKEVEVYEPGKDAVVLQEPTTLAGDPVLAGFVLDLTEVWTED